MRNHFFLWALILASGKLVAQTQFSLNAAKDYALENNLSVKKVKLYFHIEIKLMVFSSLLDRLALMVREIFLQYLHTL